MYYMYIEINSGLRYRTSFGEEHYLIEAVLLLFGKCLVIF